MPNIEPIDRTTAPDLAQVFERMEAVLGFVPNSVLTMARVPGVAEGFVRLSAPVLRNDLLSPGLVQLVAMAASTSAGSRYCQAHTSHTGHRVGVDEATLVDVYDLEASERFSDAELAALRLASAAASVPNTTTPEHFAELRRHFSEEQIAAIVAVIALFGFLNRWNDTIGTELEPPARRWGEESLAPAGWQVGKHG